MKRTLEWTLQWGVVLLLGAPIQAEAQTQRFAALQPEHLASTYVSVRTRPADVPALGGSIALQLEGAPLDEALAQIAARTGLRLTYSTDLLPEEHRVSLQSAGIPAAEAVLRVLRGTALDLLVAPSGDAVVVERTEPAGDRVRQGTISGAVVDATSQQPLPGVSVVIVGTGRGTLTAADGRFLFAGVPDGTHRVRASMIGYGASERSVSVATGQTATVTFALEPEAVALEGIVAVGYGTQRRRDVAGAITSVRAEELQRQQVTSVETGLQGRAPGVQVTHNSGAPGSSPTVRIRGGNSFIGGNDPLYVVDGLPVGGSALVAINPDDVESMEVLKDAAATAIYGARGANGVVLITTRQGRPGEHRVSFESSVGVQQVGRTIDLMNAREFAEIVNERARNDRIPLPFPSLDNLPADTDWQDVIFRDAPIQDYTLSFSGGSEQTRYLLSGNYLDQLGVIRGSGFERAALRFNLDQDVGSRLKITNRINLSRTQHDVIPADGEVTVLYSTLGAAPILPVYDADGARTDPNSAIFSMGNLEHPLSHAEDPLNRTARMRLLGNVGAEYELLEGLTARALVGADYTDARQDIYNPRTLQSGRPSGSGAVARRDNISYISENTLTLDRQYGDDHRLNVLGGFTYQTNRYSEVSTSSRGFVTDDLLNNNLGAGEFYSAPTTGGNRSELASYLGRVNYTLKDRYIFSFAARYDGSSKFGANNKWGFFPSGALAWRISDEPFLADADYLSDLKLRASYGRTGNQALGDYQSLQRIVPVQVPFGNALTVGFVPANISNPDLRWETTSQFDVGVDLGLWDHRVRVTADVYRKDTEDLLATVQLPPSSGYATSLQNVGGIRNTGVELALGADLVRSENVLWSLDANFAANRNEVTATAGGVDVLAGAVFHLIGSANLIREGEPLAAFFGFQEEGLDDRGQIRYRDVDGDGTINDADRVILGDPYPDFTYGLSSSLRFRGFEVNAFLQGVQGVEVLNINRFYYANSFNRGLNQVREVLDYWTPENPDARYPRISSGTTFRLSDRWVEDASYVRLKNLRVAYTLPQRWARVARADETSVYLTASNLFTLTDYSWYDPEVSAFGGDNTRFGVDHNTFPQARTYTIGVRFGL